MMLVNLVSDDGREDCREVKRTTTRWLGDVLVLSLILPDTDEPCVPQEEGFVGTAYVMNSLGHTVARYHLPALAGARRT